MRYRIRYRGAGEEVETLEAEGTGIENMASVLVSIVHRTDGGTHLVAGVPWNAVILVERVEEDDPEERVLG